MVSGPRAEAKIWKECLKNVHDPRQHEIFVKFMAEEEAAWRIESQILLKIDHSGLTRKDISTKTFEKFEVTELNKACIEAFKSWTPELNFGIIIYGPTGTGKTHLLKALCLKWVSSHCQGCFKSAPAILQILREGMDYAGEAFSQFIKPDLLFIDDLGSERITDWGKEQLLSIIDARLSMSKNTFISTNLQLQDFPEIYGFRFANRLKEALVFMGTDGPSYRGKIYAENLQKWTETTCP